MELGFSSVYLFAIAGSVFRSVMGYLDAVVEDDRERFDWAKFLKTVLAGIIGGFTLGILDPTTPPVVAFTAGLGGAYVFEKLKKVTK